MNNYGCGWGFEGGDLIMEDGRGKMEDVAVAFWVLRAL
jgi:hypothetical protein